MTEPLKQQPKETDREYEERRARHEEQEKRNAARDPNIPVILHTIFEAFEERLQAIERKVGIRRAAKAVEKGANDSAS